MKNLTIKLALVLSLMLAQAAMAYTGVGRFVTLNPNDPVTGTIMIQQKDDRHYLVLGNDFKTKSAPDLRLVLHKDIVPTSYTSSNYIEVSRLTKINGQQMYLIPKGVNIESYQSLIVWCKQFDVTFGTAALIQLKK